jgi:hypothetical protein
LPDAPLTQSQAPATPPQSSSTAQQTGSSSSTDSKTPPTQNGAAPPATAPKSAADQLKAEEKQRMLGIVPAFNAVESGEAAPLSPGQKFDLWYHSSIDPFTFAVAGIDAGIEQAEDSYPEYHYGFVGFAKRYGASYADSVDGNFWGNAVLPSLLHQDPRYFRLGHGSFKRRLWYSAISTVRCKGDNGKWEPNYSNVAGNLIGGAISNAYYPASDRGVGLTLERGFTVTAEGAFGSLALEFYPDAIGYLKRRHHSKVAPYVVPSGAAATSPAPTPQQ